MPDSVIILGEEYKIIYCSAEDEEFLRVVDGFIDTSVKNIYIDIAQERNSGTKKNLDEYRKSVLRHEILHAFLYEPGLAENSCSVEAWGTNEEMVDWLELQEVVRWQNI